MCDLIGLFSPGFTAWQCDLFYCLVEFVNHCWLGKAGDGRQPGLPWSLRFPLASHRLPSGRPQWLGDRWPKESLSARFPDQVLDQRRVQAKRPGPARHLSPSGLTPALQVHVQCCLSLSPHTATAGGSHSSRNRQGPRRPGRSAQEEMGAGVSRSPGHPREPQ